MCCLLFNWLFGGLCGGCFIHGFDIEPGQISLLAYLTTLRLVNCKTHASPPVRPRSLVFLILCLLWKFQLVSTLIGPFSFSSSPCCRPLAGNYSSSVECMPVESTFPSHFPQILCVGVWVSGWVSVQASVCVCEWVSVGVCCTHLFSFFPLAFVFVNDLFSAFSLFLFSNAYDFVFVFVAVCFFLLYARVFYVYCRVLPDVLSLMFFHYMYVWMKDRVRSEKIMRGKKHYPTSSLKRKEKRSTTT